MCEGFRLGASLGAAMGDAMADERLIEIAHDDLVHIFEKRVNTMVNVMHQAIDKFVEESLGTPDDEVLPETMSDEEVEFMAGLVGCTPEEFRERVSSFRMYGATLREAMDAAK